VVCFLVQWRGARAAVCLGPLGYFFTRLVNVRSSGVWFFSVKKSNINIAEWSGGKCVNGSLVGVIIVLTCVRWYPLLVYRCYLLARVVVCWNLPSIVSPKIFKY
jgi:hypothetical protein